MEVSNKEIKALADSLKSLNYEVYTRPYELNIVGIRKDSTVPNSFDDTMIVFWKDDKGNSVGEKYEITTDPGTYWLTKPMNVDGTAILKEGQYVKSHGIGKHRGKYDALTQKRNVTVYRDYDRNAILDFNNGKETTGLYGINIHKAGSDSSSVDKWSAGCQVFKREADFNEFMGFAKKHKDLYGNDFTYTLIDERAYNRRFKRYSAYTSATIIGVLAAYVLFRTYKKLPLIPEFIKKRIK